jgi:hypothetical protein
MLMLIILHVLFAAAKIITHLVMRIAATLQAPRHHGAAVVDDGCVGKRGRLKCGKGLHFFYFQNSILVLLGNQKFHSHWLYELMRWGSTHFSSSIRGL